MASDRVTTAAPQCRTALPALGALLLLLLCAPAHAQRDTLSYDGIRDIAEGQLVAYTTFPGELDVIFNARFTPSEKCWLEGVIIGCSMVRFAPAAPPDSLIVWVYEAGSVPSLLTSVQATYKIGLGQTGFPDPNFNPVNPLGSFTRGLVYVPFPFGIVFSPKREFIIGVRPLSAQQYVVGDGQWNGFNLLARPNSPEFMRYGRYMITAEPSMNRNSLAVGGLDASLLIRAVVRYDATLPPTTLTGVDNAAAAAEIDLEQNHPNPFAPETSIPFSIAQAGSVRIDILDMAGRVVATPADGTFAAGRHAVQFDAHTLPPGTYTARMLSHGRARMRMMTLLR